MKRHLLTLGINLIAVAAAMYTALPGGMPVTGRGTVSLIAGGLCVIAFLLLPYSKGMAVQLSYMGLMLSCYEQPSAVMAGAMCVYGFVTNVYLSDRIEKAAHVIISTVVAAAAVTVSVLNAAGLRATGETGMELITCLAAVLQLAVIARTQWVRTGNMKTVIGMTKARSETDVLTGLNNRQNMTHFIAEQAGFASVFSIMMCDIDHFKKINDTYGHEEGDVILKRLSDLIRETIRSSDQAFRFGGEEFCIVLPKTSVDNAFKLAERIRTGFQKMPYRNGDRIEHFTISIGVAECRYGEFTSGPEEEDNEENRVKTLIKKADEALYKAKTSGKNRTIRY